ncbi:hypothetical protein FGIG_09326 [Fasciola gigantica]|uniref:Major facilitator superfamily (MFS) profile domain-containing protein n=1 Tax=Fasciola gigantica TaxID=46835 RepID=A0A504Y7P9_FASGI|nr:hypothetical protein FGIG_09326 [Fasciola gigantica]
MSEKKLLAISFCYLVLDIFAFSLVLPWLPTLFEFFEEKPDGLHRFTKTIIRRVSSVLSIKNPASWDNVVMGGLVTSAFSLCHCLSSTLAGALSDLYSRRPLLISLQVIPQSFE